jgi:hypothetical protein
MTLAALLLTSSPARAQSCDDYDECDGRRVDARTLAGHTYVPSTLVDWPFIVSRVASTTSLGRARLELGLSTLAARLDVQGTDHFVYADQSLIGAVAITPWLSLTIRAQGSIVVPTRRIGALLLGQHGMYGGDVIAAVRLLRTDRLQVTALLDGGQLWPCSVVPARLPSSPLAEGDVTTIRPAVALAYTLSRRLGLQASASYAWRQFDIVGEQTFNTIAASAAMTIDAQPVPLTFLLAGQYAHELEDASSTDATSTIFDLGNSSVWAEAGVVYRDRPELDLGVVADWKLSDLDRESRWFAQVRLGYYFI